VRLQTILHGIAVIGVQFIAISTVCAAEENGKVQFSPPVLPREGNTKVSFSLKIDSKPRGKSEVLTSGVTVESAQLHWSVENSGGLPLIVNCRGTLSNVSFVGGGCKNDFPKSIPFSLRIEDGKVVNLKLEADELDASSPCTIGLQRVVGSIVHLSLGVYVLTEQPPIQRWDSWLEAVSKPEFQ